ncbi:putative bifunctional diguanylate cyclase/phosphodiesterase [Pseudomonas japonica]|uniref:putative bifunctional diguanylate cyclase/phosphodiesterase n=1 Tax=Pseudomonas japonica TaxID=256466 RepID=UPI0015E32353|nr:GGDEF and EAL domain-containing protein [Pseudomonas japonica]MBA1290385.1 EAL domain-containing protein [Pseudomonas japonica]
MKKLPEIVESSIRQRAERALDEFPITEESRVWRDLQLHQVELEMQNEELRRLQGDLESSRDRYLDLYEQAPVGYLGLSASGMVEGANARAEQLLGVSRKQLLGRRFDRWVHPGDRAQWTALFVRACRDMRAHTADLTLLRNDGQPLAAHLDCVRQHGGARHVRLTLTDISELRRAEAKLALAANVFTHAHEAIMITDAVGTILEVNEAFQTITGYCRHDVLGRNPRILASGQTPRSTYTALWQALHEKGFWKGEVSNRRSDGQLFIAGQTITAIHDDSGEVRNFVSLFTDVTQLREHQARLEKIAHYDALTQLPNRVLLAQRMQQLLGQAHASGGSLAVVYLDLDGFKAANDQHGHATGDRVLIVVAQRMKNTLREGWLASRLGGDEFVLLIPGLEDHQHSTPILERILKTIAEPIEVDGVNLQLSASMGVTFYPQPQEVGPDQLLRQADQAMYQAKLAGRGCYYFFDQQLEQDLLARNARVERIVQAMSQHELVLYYQPKVNMRSGKVVGVEALIRWQHPEEGLLLPETFLPCIENDKVSQLVGEWVIRQALEQTRRWADHGCALPVSVNIGSWQLQQPDFVEFLRHQLLVWGNAPDGMLTIEILETSALRDMDRVSETIVACRKIGVRFALDDFGTGYSSLSYLNRLPVSQLKIDKSFVQDIPEANDNLSILQAITGLAHAFDREVIAEGVDSLYQGVRLLELGCDHAQGFCIAEPMPAQEIVGWMRAWAPPEAWRLQPQL